MTEEQEKERYAKTLDIMHEMEKEFEVLGNAYKMQEQALEKLKAEYKTQAELIQRMKKDLGLSTHHAYRNKTTRELAQEAFNQSTVTANWAGLGAHPVIVDVYEAIKIRSSNEGRRADDVLRKLENQMSVEEFFEQLSESSEVLEIKEEISELDKSYDNLADVQKVDRHNIYEKIHLQRDTIADIQTANDMKDYLQSEMIIAYDGAFIFLMGALAEMGKGEIENGLRFMLRKPKVENDDGKKTTETPESSQG